MIKDAPIKEETHPSIPNPPTLEKTSTELSVLNRFQERKLFKIPKCNSEPEGIFEAMLLAIQILPNGISGIFDKIELYSCILNILIS